MPDNLWDKKEKYDEDMSFYIKIINKCNLDIEILNGFIPTQLEKKLLLNIAVDYQKSCREIL